MWCYKSKFWKPFMQALLVVTLGLTPHTAECGACLLGLDSNTTSSSMWTHVRPASKQSRSEYGTQASLSLCLFPIRLGRWSHWTSLMDCRAPPGTTPSWWSSISSHGGGLQAKRFRVPWPVRHHGQNCPCGGHAYVYLCYGLHMMLNVVADKEGVGAAVLIRACAPVSGLELIQQRRGQQTEKPILLTGPGKVGQALGLSTDWSNHPLYTPGGLEVLDAPEPENILVGPRVGIEYASPEHVMAPWRFAVAGTPWISAPKNTLRPQ
ncbi:hypothetical protein ACQJBY_055736 [Aegilops geniculata]